MTTKGSQAMSSAVRALSAHLWIFTSPQGEPQERVVVFPQVLTMTFNHPGRPQNRRNRCQYPDRFDGGE